MTNFTGKLAKLPLKHQPGEAYTYGVNQDMDSLAISKRLITRLSNNPIAETANS